MTILRTVEQFIESNTSDREAIGAAWSGPHGESRAIWQGEGTGEEEPRFVIYSITKTMTATILLALQEVGRLHVDAPLSDFFPDIAGGEGISLRRMLNHSAGFPDYGGLESYRRELAAHPERPWDFERYAEETWRKGMLFAPGEGWSYSNPAYMLLRMVAENITEMSFRELVDYWIVRPLNLQRTGVVEEIADLHDLVPAPSAALATDGSIRDIRRYYHPGWVSHGLVASTPSEIVRFYAGLISGELLTDHTLEEMTRGVRVPDDSPQWGRPGYGLGLMIDPESRHGRFLGHGGGGPGTTTFAAHFPDEQLTICIMSAGEKREAEDGVWGVKN